MGIVLTDTNGINSRGDLIFPEYTIILFTVSFFVRPGIYAGGRGEAEVTDFRITNLD